MESVTNQEVRPAQPIPFFKVTLLRHEEPLYKDVGHDLTEEGVRNAKEKGRQMKEKGIISENDNLILFHSPQARARGTLEFIAEGAGIPHDSKRQTGQLRKSDFKDPEAFMDRVQELGSDIELIAEDHYKNPMYEERPDIIEPSSNKKRRLYRAMEYLLRSFDKKKEIEGGIPHLIAVSHFEIITHFINDVFGIENIGRYNAPAYGEMVHIEAYKTDAQDKALLRVSFNDVTKNVYFNRKERSIEQIK